MFSKPYAIFFILLLLPSCSCNKMRDSVPQYLLIQALLEAPTLTLIKETLTCVTNKIIREELGLAEDNTYPFFMPKDRPYEQLTLYYIDKVDERNQTLILSAIDDLQKNTPVHTTVATLLPRVEFFGNQHDELVIMIGDPEGQLAALNHRITNLMHNLDNTYKQSHNIDLYDVIKSERFPFLPHISLGKIRLMAIGNHIKKASQVHKTLIHIKERIKKEAEKIIPTMLTADNQNISSNKIGLFDLKKQNMLKEYIVGDQ